MVRLWIVKDCSRIVFCIIAPAAEKTTSLALPGMAAVGVPDAALAQLLVFQALLVSPRQYSAVPARTFVGNESTKPAKRTARRPANTGPICLASTSSLEESLESMSLIRREIRKISQ